MPSIQVKNVPEDVHAVLRRRAGESGQSLQEYLLALLADEAHRPTIAELLERVGHRTGGSVGFDEAVAAVRAERDSR
ncbi:MAG: hypothetical protein RIE08_18540 [Acidimicrobiales bacterium]